MAAERRSAARHALTALSGNALRYGLQLLALVVFSRLLTPADFGLVAMVTAVVGIAYVLGDFGLSLAALQSAELTQAQRSNLFWLNTGIGMLLAAAICVAAVPLAAFYGDPQVVPVTLAVSIVFAVNGIGVQFRTEINRALRFSVLATADVAGQAIGFAAALGIVALGGGYWALVGMQVIAAVATNTILIARARWWPGWYRRREPMRELLHFGTFTLLTQVVTYAATNIDQLVVGRVWGTTVVGYYNRAFQVARIPSQQIASPLTRVFLPHLARLRDDPGAFGRAVGRAQLGIAALWLGLLGVMAAAAEPLVAVVLGPGWGDAVPILRALCLASTFQAMGYIIYVVLLAIGRIRLLFLAEIGPRLVTIALVILVAPLGPVPVALAVAVGELLVFVSSSAFALPRAGVSVAPILVRALRTGALFAIAAAATWALGIAAGAPSWPAVVALLGLIVVYIAVIAVALVLPVYRRDAGELLEFVRSIRSQERADA